MADNGLNIFQVAGRAMSAQLIRMNTTASNLANAGAITGSADTRLSHDQAGVPYRI